MIWVRDERNTFTLVPKDQEATGDDIATAEAECQPLPTDASRLERDCVEVSLEPEKEESESESSSVDPPPPPPPFVYHTVDLGTDTLLGLSLRYNVPIRTIRSLNSFSGDLLTHAPSVLKFPVSGAPTPAVLAVPVLSAEATRARQVAAFGSSHGTSRQEALYYLSATDFDVAAAAEELALDREWAKKHDGDFKPAEGGHQQRSGKTSSTGVAGQLLKKEKGKALKPPLEIDQTSSRRPSVLEALKRAFGALQVGRGGDCKAAAVKQKEKEKEKENEGGAEDGCAGADGDCAGGGVKESGEPK